MFLARRLRVLPTNVRVPSSALAAAMVPPPTATDGAAAAGNKKEQPVVVAAAAAKRTSITDFFARAAPKRSKVAVEGAAAAAGGGSPRATSPVAALARGVCAKAGAGDEAPPPQPAPWDDVTAPSDTKEEEQGEKKEAAAAAAKPPAPQQQPQQQQPKALSPAEMAALAQANAQKVQEVIAAARAAGAGAGGGAGGAAAAPNPPSAAPANSTRYPRLFDLLVEPSWREALKGEFDKPYARRLEAFVHGEWARNGGRVYPPVHQVFRALNSVPLDQCRVIVLGQDPYHGPGQAEGLSFSVPRGVAVPSSLRNIYKELADDVPGFRPPGHGSLEAWAHQGVLLLNATLTVRGGDANSHAKTSGWLEFTTAVVEALSRRRKGLVFLLWGKFAQDRAAAARVDAKKHHLLKSPHPSGLSAHRGFFGCRHFSAANALLEKEGLPPIDWRLPG